MSLRSLSGFRLLTVLVVLCGSLLAIGCDERSSLLPLAAIEPIPYDPTLEIEGGAMVIGSGPSTIATPTTLVERSTVDGKFDITGTVYDNISLLGVGNVAISLDPTSTTESKKVWSYTSGRFRFNEIMPGNHLIEFKKDDYADFYYGFTLSATGRVTAPFDVFLDRRKYSVRGSVIRKGTTTGVDSAGVAIAEISSMHTLTTTDGRFTLPSVPSGLYTFILTKSPGYIESRYLVSVIPGTSDVAVTDPTLLTLTIVPNVFKISGHVREKFTDNPLAGADTWLYDSLLNEKARTKTTSEGLFTFSNMSPGLYSILIHLDGYRTATSVVELFDDGTTSPLDAGISLATISASLRSRPSSDAAGFEESSH